MEKLYIATEGDFLTLVRTAVREELAQLVPGKAESARLPSGTRVEVAKHLQISLSKLDQMTRSGELKSFKMGRQVRYKWLDLDEYLNKKG